MLAVYDRARRSLALSWLLDNPLLVREIRRRMRGRLFSWSLIGYLAALGVVSIGIMFFSYPKMLETLDLRARIQHVGRIGTTLFKGMCLVEGFIALFIAPMLTAGLATAEKEKDTFDFLRVTTLRARTFVLGCLLTTASFLLLIFTCTLPILGLTFIFGGVSMQEILGFNIFIFLAAMAISAWGIFNSTGYKRSRSVQGSVLVVVFVAFFLGSRVLTAITGKLLSPYGVIVSGTWLATASWLAPFIIAIALFSVAAARRLYDTNNRLFSYKQYTGFYAAILFSVGGTLAYRMSGYSFAPLGATQVSGYLTLFFFAGYVAVLASIVIFSAGRIERGDEVWQIRHQVSIFRRVPEAYFFYGAYLFFWLYPAYSMGQAWDNGTFTKPFFESIPIALVSVLFVLSLVRFLNAFSENRNRIAIWAILSLVILWGIAPALGFFIDELTGPGKNGAGDLLAPVANVLKSLSPVLLLFGIWNGDPQGDASLGCIITLILSFLLIVPTLTKWWRNRVLISYEWTISKPKDAPAEGT